MQTKATQLVGARIGNKSFICTVLYDDGDRMILQDTRNFPLSLNLIKMKGKWVEQGDTTKKEVHIYSDITLAEPRDPDSVHPFELDPWDTRIREVDSYVRPTRDADELWRKEIKRDFPLVIIPKNHQGNYRELYDGLDNILRPDRPSVELANWAARHGFFDMLVGLFNLGVEPMKETGEKTALGGYLEILKWLVIPKPQADKPPAFILLTEGMADLAVISGNLDMIKWIYQESGHLPSLDGASAAKGIGHGEIVDWLAGHNIHPLDCYPHYAFINGKVDVVKKLHANGIPLASLNAYCWNNAYWHDALRSDNPELLEWMYNMERGMSKPSNDKVTESLREHRFRSVDWAISKGVIPDTSSIDNGKTDTDMRGFRWLHSHGWFRPSSISRASVVAMLVSDADDWSLKWLESTGYRYDQRTMNDVTEMCARNAVIRLVSQGLYPDEQAVNNAKCDMRRWLFEATTKPCFWQERDGKYVYSNDTKKETAAIAIGFDVEGTLFHRLDDPAMMPGRFKTLEGFVESGHRIVIIANLPYAHYGKLDRLFRAFPFPVTVVISLGKSKMDKPPSSLWECAGNVIKMNYVAIPTPDNIKFASESGANFIPTEDIFGRM